MPRPSQILGWKNNFDPEYGKTCAETWAKYGNYEKAGKELGISGLALRTNAWRYLLRNLDYTREFLNSEAGIDKRFERNLNEMEFNRLVVRRALSYFRPGSFRIWFEENMFWQYPELIKMFELKYPLYYRTFWKLYETLEKARSGEVS
jgi:hypothetical protein